MLGQNMQLEQIKKDFSFSEYLNVRDLTFKLLDQIADNISVGMWEKEAMQMAEQVLKDAGYSFSWHRIYVRFGENTIKGYKDPIGPDIKLKPNDIFYVDIAPVFNGYEGDAGATYTRGNDPDMQQCQKDVKIIFEKCKKYWQKNQCSGIEIYQYAAEITSLMGWVLDTRTDGHRLSDFSHRQYCTTKLSQIPFPLSPLLWVVEIHIVHPTRPFGAFYEDLIF